MANKQAAAMLILGSRRVPSFGVILTISMRHQWFTFVRLSNPYMTRLIAPFDRDVHHLTVSD